LNPGAGNPPSFSRRGRRLIIGGPLAPAHRAGFARFFLSC
jgi:hypothetical protein